ncbi:hypothetical protein IEQ34_012536 [Dendrobium chrysotoxum]|uniref:Uncharacterized protein n=1 Tax=Dendrobium chrysotoxum TaxID=161865 RepID=A0AAV7GVX0_DENCH|nr:hypothetical protein IEQ34_012536 [Dendrobium chrysotoxum]
MERLTQSVRSGEYPMRDYSVWTPDGSSVWLYLDVIRTPHKIINPINENGKSIDDNIVVCDPLDNERREKVEEAMLHAWNSYEKHACGIHLCNPV